MVNIPQELLAQVYQGWGTIYKRGGKYYQICYSQAQGLYYSMELVGNDHQSVLELPVKM